MTTDARTPSQLWVDANEAYYRRCEEETLLHGQCHCSRCSRVIDATYDDDLSFQYRDGDTHCAGGYGCSNPGSP